ncbi:MAG: hypothetical protein K8T25_02950 [Planctomycetia bacterium]|jgi:hypothetical protein|nr:hypothetical protein [Planctomycetia bacterium]
MKNEYFSLESALGTARALIYWRELSDERKTEILLSLSGRRAPDPQVLELILAEGNPLHIDLAFRCLRYATDYRSAMCDDPEPFRRAYEFIDRIWKERLGFSPWGVESIPLNLVSDFYAWLRGESVEGLCAELQAWADSFYSRSQFERKVIIEHGSCLPFWAAVGVLAVGVRQKKLMCEEAAELFVTAIAMSYDENTPSSMPCWDIGLTYDYAVVIAAFLSAVATEDRSDENDTDEITFSPLFKVIRNLPQLIVSDESVEPLLSVHPRALSMLFRYGNREERRHDLAVLKQRIAEGGA